MLKKVVIFDNGFGGELFADYLEEEVPVMEVIRVIDWRNSDKILRSPKEARKVAMAALRPYIGKVDLIVFANYLISVTSLKYFQRKFKKQKFVGFTLRKPNKAKAQRALILTTSALHKTLNYHIFVKQMRLKIKTVDCDEWVELVDDGELTEQMIYKRLVEVKEFRPNVIMLGCTQFVDIKSSLVKIFGPTTAIDDQYGVMTKKVCKVIGLRGLDGKRYK